MNKEATKEKNNTTLNDNDIFTNINDLKTVHFLEKSRAKKSILKSSAYLKNQNRTDASGKPIDTDHKGEYHIKFRENSMNEVY
jgi:hypothetical protein